MCLYAENNSENKKLTNGRKASKESETEKNSEREGNGLERERERRRKGKMVNEKPQSCLCEPKVSNLRSVLRQL